MNKEKAITSIKRRIAEPMKITVEEAAHKIRETTEKNIQDELLHFLKEKGINTAKLSDYALVAYGGGGPTRYGGFIGDLKFGRILTSPYASTFCAFGFSTTDLLHRYSKYLPLTLFDGVNYLKDYKMINETVAELMDVARRDIGGEGFSANEAGYYLELIGDGDLAEYNIRLDKIQLTSEEDIKQICAQFGKLGKQGSARVTISNIILNAVVPMPHYELKKRKLSGKNPSAASKGQRDIFWSPEIGYRSTSIYDSELLVPGNKVTGPAVVDAKDTTYVVPENKSYYISEYAHGVLGEV